jgi:predicted O-methyltransferase YrrM
MVRFAAARTATPLTGLLRLARLHFDPAGRTGRALKLKSPFAGRDLGLAAGLSLGCAIAGVLGGPTAAVAVGVGWLTLFIRHTARRQSERADEVALRAEWARANFYTQIERLLALHAGGLHTTVAPLPPFGGWAIAPDFAALLASMVVRTLRGRQEGRVTIVELGSGVSTLVCGYLAMKHGGIRVISVEHQAEHVSKMRAEVALHDLTSHVQIVHAPLTKVSIDDTQRTWYEPSFIDRLPPIDLLIVDGPPATSDPAARYPALPLLGPRCPPGATILVDDARRDRPVIDDWLARHPRATAEFVEVEKGACILRLPEVDRSS